MPLRSVLQDHLAFLRETGVSCLMYGNGIHPFFCWYGNRLHQGRLGEHIQFERLPENRETIFLLNFCEPLVNEI